MNVYDFDKTIYDGDSSVKFLMHLYRKRPWYLFSYGIESLLAFVLYKIKAWDKEKMKEVFFSVMLPFHDREELIEKFWDKEMAGIKDFYKKQQKPDDLIISASPLFLIEVPCRRLGVACMATPMDLTTGKYTGRNCHGEQKIVVYRQKYGYEPIETFYSDSHSDDPMAKIAQKAIMVKGEELFPWPFK